MNQLFDTNHLIRRPTQTKLDDTPIHVGDVVHLQLADGPVIRARVIYNAPINGTTTYTTELIRCAGDDKASHGQRIRFRHEHVHRIEPVRSLTH
ncbi:MULTISPECIES: hypothetical protein [Bordetella]|uniref:Uncharacterized protein n=1 Tax=Bordetella genomosp. 6 TaxID=463024 RepID=A0ABX4FBA1_9BORD|nr:MULTISPECIES: hypothetical protein [Bordetella]AOB27569.1 hypothetical protein BBB44_15610 [Bordetella bronchiseptica]ARP77291.1 hypothetical protein CAL11_14595 [Bordetella genomosp. 6]AZW44889.1 hypothetical protein CWR61_15765 [Bordetella bronchiseptica]KCV63558.1 hypothetical protein L493_1906 [Bordetella bronchiseptica 99-R-0433]MBN3265876.1 hypothetical protein [Bordetella bronchiseptica]